MLTVELRPELAEQLNKEAKRRQTSVDELVNQWLAEELWKQRVQIIHEESKRFQEQHAQLYRQYANQYVAMRDGVVLDHDTDLTTLHNRIRARYGDEPILMTPVTPEPVPTYRVLSPRRGRIQG